MARDATTPDKPAMTNPPRRRRGRWWWTTRLSALASVLVIALIVLVTQTGVLTRFVVPAIERETGLSVVSARVTLDPSGRVVLDDAIMRAPGIDGPGGELIRMRRAEIEFDWLRIFSGAGAITRVHLINPLLRVSQDTRSGTVNLASLDLGSGGGGTIQTPPIVIDRGVLELGEHDNGAYERLKRLSVAGELTAPDKDGVARLDIAARQTRPGAADPLATGRPDISITGEVASDGSITARMSGITLEDWPPSIVPSRIRGRYAALNLEGDTGRATFRMNPDGRINASLELTRVDLDLPIKPVAGGPGEVKPLRMTNTRGTLTFGTNRYGADLEGDIDRLGYKVDLSAQGYGADAALKATVETSVRIDDAFRGLLFVPPSITGVLDRFSGVSMEVDATIELERDAGAPLDVSGTARITDGTATYKDFPYPAHDIAARVSFAQDSVEIEEIRATGPTGATIMATGAFKGFGDDARVELNITAGAMPIDDALIGALGPDERELVRTLFARSEYNELTRRGLVLSPETSASLQKERDTLASRLRARAELPGHDEDQDERAGLESEIARLDERLATPVFDFGGEIELAVSILRDPARPPDDNWVTDVDATLTRAGIVPRQFPLPINARDVQLSVREDLVTLAGGSYEGLEGGWASVEARVERGDDDDDPGASGAGGAPTIEIEAGGIPIDRRLIAAIPGADESDPQGAALARILDRLRLTGTVACDALIGPRSDGSLGYDIEASILEGSARPRSSIADPDDDASRLAIDVAFGTIFVTETMIVVSLDGQLRADGIAAEPSTIGLVSQLTLEPPRPEGPQPDMAGPPSPGPALLARVRSDALDLTLPIEDALEVVTPGLGVTIRDRREQAQPEGVVAFLAVLEGRVGSMLGADLRLERIDGLGLTLAGQRYDLASMEGLARVRSGLETSAVFEGVRVPVLIDGERAGTLEIDGTLPIARAGDLIELDDEPTMRAAIHDGRLDAQGMRGVIARAGSDGARAFLDDYGIGGRFDLDARITPKDQTRVVQGTPGTYTLPELSLEGTLEPHALSIERMGSTLMLDSIKGRVAFNAGGGRVERIVARSSDGTRVGVDGLWRTTEDQGVTIDLAMHASTGGMSDTGGSVRAALPDALLGVMDQLELRVGSTTDLERMRIRADGVGTDAARFDIEGDALLRGVSLRLGVDVTDMDTRAKFRVESRPGQRVRYDIDLDAQRLRADTLRMHNASVQVRDDPETPGAVLIPEFRAGMHGGIITGRAWAGPGETPAGDPTVDPGDMSGGAAVGPASTWIETDLRASGVRAAPVFDDLGLPAGGIMGPPPPPGRRSHWSWNVNQDLSRGAMTASVSLRGPVDDPDLWEGRGTARIQGGSVVDMPGLINLIEASNLALPSGASLDLADADLYLDGTTMAFERLSISSSNIEIFGYGTLDWTSREVDLRFRSRSIDPIPFVSDVLEGIRDELITTRVTGAFGSIDYRVEQFGTTKRIIDAMLGNTESEQQRRLREVQRRSRPGSGRYRDDSGETLERPTAVGDNDPGLSTTDATGASLSPD